MLRIALVVGLLATLFAPTAVALPSCAAVTEASAVAVGGFYVVADPGVWSEVNGVPGLQRQACVDANGQGRPADGHLSAVPDLPCRVSGRTIVCEG